MHVLCNSLHKVLGHLQGLQRDEKPDVRMLLDHMFYLTPLVSTGPHWSLVEVAQFPFLATADS